MSMSTPVTTGTGATPNVLLTHRPSVAAAQSVMPVPPTTTLSTTTAASAQTTVTQSIVGPAVATTIGGITPAPVASTSTALSGSSTTSVADTHPCKHRICHQMAKKGWCLITNPEKKLNGDGQVLKALRDGYAWSDGKGKTEQATAAARKICGLIWGNVILSLCLTVFLIATISLTVYIARKPPSDVAALQTALHETTNSLEKALADTSEYRTNNDRCVRERSEIRQTMEALKRAAKTEEVTIGGLRTEAERWHSSSVVFADKYERCKSVLQSYTTSDYWTWATVTDMTYWWHYLIMVCVIIVWSLSCCGLKYQVFFVGAAHLVATGAGSMDPMNFVLGPWTCLWLMTWWRWICLLIIFCGYLTFLAYHKQWAPFAWHMIMLVPGNVATWALSYYMGLTVATPWSAMIMYAMMTFFHWSMWITLWSQGSIVTTTTWDGDKTTKHDQNPVQSWWWNNVLGSKKDPAPVPSGGKVKKKVHFVRGETFFPDSKPQDEARFGSPHIAYKTLQKCEPWTVLNAAQSWTGSAFPYKGVLVTPEHVWESCGKRSDIDMRSPSGKHYTLKKLGKMSTSGEHLICFECPQGVQSLKASKQSGTIETWMRARDGEEGPPGVSWGTANTYSCTHNLTTQPGDSGAPVCDTLGNVVCVHVASTPAVNLGVVPPASEDRFEFKGLCLDGCDCEEDCTCCLAQPASGSGEGQPDSPSSKGGADRREFESDDEEDQEGRSGKSWKRGKHAGKRKKKMKVFSEEEYDDLVHNKKMSPAKIRQLVQHRMSSAYLGGYDPEQDARDGVIPLPPVEEARSRMLPALYEVVDLPPDGQARVTHTEVKGNWMVRVTACGLYGKNKTYTEWMRETPLDDIVEWCSLVPLVCTVTRMDYAPEPEVSKNFKSPPGQRGGETSGKRSRASWSQKKTQVMEKARADLLKTLAETMGESMSLDQLTKLSQKPGSSGETNPPVRGTPTNPLAGR